MPWRLIGFAENAPRRNDTGLLVATLVAGLLGLLLFAVAYQTDAIGSFDAELAARVAEDMPVAAEWLARPFHWLGSWIGMTPITIGVVGFALVSRRLAAAVWVGLTLVGVHIVTALLKEAFDRARPDEGSAIPLPPSDSFPSGHASGTVVTFGVIALLASERWPYQRRRLWALTAAVVLAVGASRVVLNVHYLTDVPAGWCLGLAWLAAALLVREAIRARRDRSVV